MENRNTKFEFSASLRWTHWIRAVSIVVLIVTGFYLAFVFISPIATDEPVIFMNDKFRMWHQIAGFILIGATIFKTYLFFFDKMSLKELVSFRDFLSPKVWFEQIKFYLFLGEHPKLRGAYNPIQLVAYVGLYVMIYIICITGLIMYVHNFHDGLGGFLYDFMRPLEVMLGGLAVVREIHHISMWGIIIFIPIHVYMAVFNSIMGVEGSIDSIVSGYKFEKKH